MRGGCEVQRWGEGMFEEGQEARTACLAVGISKYQQTSVLEESSRHSQEESRACYCELLEELESH